MKKKRFATSNIVEQSNDREKYDIIHRHIKSVSITNCPDRKATKKIEITIFPLHRFDKSKVIPYYYSYRLKDKSKQVFRKFTKWNPETNEFETNYIEYLFKIIKKIRGVV